MTNRFDARKQNILAQLETPDSEYHDLSPKGSVDEPIRELIDEINTLEGLVTTSSCSGRISVFLEGRKAGSDDELGEGSAQSRAGPGGKGGGGAWLFISHTRIEASDADTLESFSARFGLENAEAHDGDVPGVNSRFVHLKFEPMILHILTASTNHAQRVLTAALSAGFRESGAVSLSATKTGESTPMVAVRSAGYSFDSIIGYQDSSGRNVSMVDGRYLKTLVAIANDRFRINVDRIARFQSALMDVYKPSDPSTNGSAKPEWEDAGARKRRKREEGLARQQALQTSSSAEDGSGKGAKGDDDAINGMFD